jgi:hypothetical protein
MEVTASLLRILATRIRQLRRGKYQTLKPYALHWAGRLPGVLHGKCMLPFAILTVLYDTYDA